MTHEELYCLGLIVEELCEAGQIIGKAIRFGIDTPGPDNVVYHGETARELLEKELGDVWAAMLFARKHGLVDSLRVVDHASAKLSKLMDPTSVDNLGRRLATAAPGHP